VEALKEAYGLEKIEKAKWKEEEEESRQRKKEKKNTMSSSVHKLVLNIEVGR
jgi:hypothetical protein